MKTNPFELTFGLKPDNYISRLKQSEEIISSFEEGTNHIFMMPLKNIADTNQGFADRLKKSFDTKSLR